MGRLIGRESPTEYFKELVESALEHQQVDVAAETEYYVVDLLVRFGIPPATETGEALGVRLVRALNEAGFARYAALRQVGDLALMMTGFFPDFLERRLADLGYYRTLGVSAYVALSQEADRALAPVFADLGKRFVPLMDVLSEVAEQTTVGTATKQADLLKVYDRWLRTGSRRSGERLVEKGIVPNLSVRSASRSVQ